MGWRDRARPHIASRLRAQDDMGIGSSEAERAYACERCSARIQSDGLRATARFRLANGISGIGRHEMQGRRQFFRSARRAPLLSPTRSRRRLKMAKFDFAEPIGNGA